MLIKKLSLLNFRQFRKSEIVFSQDETRNVTVIMGENGAGKTTLAQAFQWALYGETAFVVKEVINRDVRQRMESGASVTVSVILEVEYDGKDYTVKRSQIHGKSGGRIIAKPSELRISYKDRNGNSEYLPPHRVAYMIKQMLPKELSGFFFFDGERINEMSKEIEDGKSSEFKTAVHGLTGLTATRNAMAHLKREDSAATIIGRLDKKIYADSMSNIKVEQYDKEIQSLREKREKLKKRQEEIELKISVYERQADEQNYILMSASNDMKMKDRLNRLNDEILSCEKYKLLNISSALLPLIDKDAYSFLAWPLLKGVVPELSGIEELDKSIPKLSRDTLLHILKRRECLCGCRLEVGTDEFNRVNELINYVPPKSISMQAEDFKKTSKRIEAAASDFFGRLTSGMQTARKYDEDIDVKSQEASELYDQISDTTRGEIARKELNELKRSLGMLRREYAENAVKADSLNKDIERKETEKKKLVIITENTRRLMLYKAYAERVYNDLAASYKSKEEETRELLEKKINEIFADIYDGNISITVDSRYNIRVASVNRLKIEDNLEKNTAQSYAIIFAFITAIIAIAKDKAVEAKKDADEDSIYIETDGYPLVMDAPLSAFDKTRIKKICEAMPAIAKQVIIFIKDTDGEVAEEHMADVIGAKYIVEKEDGSNLYSVIERR